MKAEDRRPFERKVLWSAADRLDTPLVGDRVQISKCPDVQWIEEIGGQGVVMAVDILAVSF